MKNAPRESVAKRRNYYITTVNEAKEVVKKYLKDNSNLDIAFSFGLPEINDRYHSWKVPLVFLDNVIGDVIVDAYSGEIDSKQSSEISIILDRVSKVKAGENVNKKSPKNKTKEFKISTLPNLLIKGRAELALQTLPEESIDLVFTSPPYYNARKEYSEYDSYDDYLLTMRKVIRECHRVLIDGKFFVINSSHVLVPRASRSEASQRIAVPFDLHQIILEEGFEFVDDIIWQKPEGAGWASGRGRRFSADRNPMQYKAVPVTEYVMAYRKKPCGLIDHFIRDNPDQSIIEKSKIPDGYEKTNVWYISPGKDKRHPAIFPAELADKVIQYYSFVNDVVLDPFGGIGTTAKSALKLGRRFCSIEIEEKYITATKDDLSNMNDLMNPIKYEFRDESKSSLSCDLPSFEHLVHKLIHNGYSKEELYDILKKAVSNKNELNGE